MERIIPKKKKKKFKYMRECSLKISNDCLIIFRAEKKRTHVCSVCKAQLKKVNLWAMRYKKMKEDGYEESVDWKSNDEGVMTYTDKTPLYNDKNELVGHSQKKITVNVKKEDLEYNLELKKEMLDKAKKQVDELKSGLGKIGKKPVRTPEMIRIEKAMQSLFKIKDVEKKEAQLKQKEEEIKEYEEFIRKRTVTLMTAPEKKK